METILIVDDEEFLRKELERILGEEGYTVRGVETGAGALEVVDREGADLVLLDLNLPDVHGVQVLREIKARDPEALVIVVTGYGSVESAVESLKLGAYDFIKKPFKADAIKLIVRLALETQRLRRRVRVLRERELASGQAVVAESPAMAEVLRQARDVAGHSDTTVLITGESGTGKEIIARLIHSLSERRQAPFLEINCASIPGTMLESELFGHEAGAFTDARKAKEGLLEAANAGTVFLDEVGDMDLGLQAKVLRFLETRRIRRLGGVRDSSVDVRVVAATHRGLKEAIEGKTFREDLFYRLNVFPIRIPPLRERPEDILPLAHYFLDHFARKFRRTLPELSPEASSRLLAYGWPGNAREVKNLMERLAITCRQRSIEVDDLPDELRGPNPRQAASWLLPPEGLCLEEVERQMARGLIEQALQRTGGNVSKAAKLLGLPRGTLRHRMESLGFAPEEAGAEAS
ncbi:MAG: sigma-54-dependent Fis family transcriptional regulator [Deltaproteobacteria bacterium]|nr:sigma-54-dependent Fis family transcriptional regulator [Deltaproteobacteria bacterium]